MGPRRGLGKLQISPPVQFIAHSVDPHVPPHEDLARWLANKDELPNDEAKAHMAEILIRHLLKMFQMDHKRETHFTTALRSKLTAANWFDHHKSISSVNGYLWVKERFNEARRLAERHKKPIFPDAVTVALHFITWQIFQIRAHREVLSGIRDLENSACVLPTLIRSFKSQSTGRFFHIELPADFLTRLGQDSQRQTGSPFTISEKLSTDESYITKSMESIPAYTPAAPSISLIAPAFGAFDFRPLAMTVDTQVTLTREEVLDKHGNQLDQLLDPSKSDAELKWIVDSLEKKIYLVLDAATKRQVAAMIRNIDGELVQFIMDSEETDRITWTERRPVTPSKEQNTVQTLHNSLATVLNSRQSKLHEEDKRILRQC